MNELSIGLMIGSMECAPSKKTEGRVRGLERD